MGAKKHHIFCRTSEEVEKTVPKRRSLLGRCIFVEKGRDKEEEINKGRREINQRVHQKMHPLV